MSSITMLPAGKHVLSVYEDIAPKARSRRRCSSIPRPSTSNRRARRMRSPAGTACSRSTRRSRAALAAPTAGTLTFMAGGSDGRLRQGRADPEADGRPHRPLRRCRRRPGGQDLQQHDPRHLDDRRRRGVRAGREARPVASGAVRRRLDLVRPVLVADHLLPGARAGAGLARQSATTSRALPRR